MSKVKFNADEMMVMLSRLAAMAGREVGSLISMVLRDFLSIQFRSALVYGTSG